MNEITILLVEKEKDCENFIWRMDFWPDDHDP